MGVTREEKHNKNAVSWEPSEESVSRKKVKVKVTQLCPPLHNPMDSIAHGILQAAVGIVHGILQAEMDPLLQGIFPTQGLNPGFPHCRRILYQLSQ